jgi:prepilin-type N-terminal cleavage/methylation domain-containing protein
MNNTIFSKKIMTSGFTLVEMIVVLGIFSLLMTLATGALYTNQKINTKLQENQSILDNVNLSMDTISKDIRYGTDFYCADSVTGAQIPLRKGCAYPTGGKVIFFRPNDVSSSTDRVAYYASSTIYGDVVLKDEYIDGATTTYQVTASNLRVKSLVFYTFGVNTVFGVGQDVDDMHDYEQPLIVLTMGGETIPIDLTASSTSFVIQTSISSRRVDK